MIFRPRPRGHEVGDLDWLCRLPADCGRFGVFTCLRKRKNTRKYSEISTLFQEQQKIMKRAVEVVPAGSRTPSKSSSGAPTGLRLGVRKHENVELVEHIPTTAVCGVSGRARMYYAHTAAAQKQQSYSCRHQAPSTEVRLSCTRGQRLGFRVRFLTKQNVPGTLYTHYLVPGTKYVLV